jgi:hypothetical protein
MKTLMIALVLTLLAGCAVVPLAPYDAYGPSYASPSYAPPVHRYYGYGYSRPWDNGYYGPRYYGYYGERGYGYHGGYGHWR